jgi:hypothetical protein
MIAGMKRREKRSKHKFKESTKDGVTKGKKEGVQQRQWCMNKDTRPTNKGKLPQGVIVLV